MLSPFRWPFILVPNLPIELLNMIESPVPFLIGILGNEKFYNEMRKKENINAEFVFINSKKIIFKVK